MTTLDEVRAALDARRATRRVLRLTDALLAARPGDDAAHEYRARAFLALGRLDEAEQHAEDAVRLDPDEIRYRELLAQMLSARARTGTRRSSTAASLATIRDRRRGRSRRPRSDSGPRSPAWGSTRPAGRCGWRRATDARSWRCPRRSRAPATLAERSRPRHGPPRCCPAIRLRGRRWRTPSGWPTPTPLRSASFAHSPRSWPERPRSRARQGAPAVAAARRMGGRLIAAVGPLFGFAFRRGWLRIADE